MQFNSLPFFVFFGCVALVYLVVPRRARCGYLLAASYIFYGIWSIKYMLFILFSTFSTWLVGRLLPGQQSNRKKWLLAGCAAANLLLLGFFKYFAFFLNNLSLLLSRPLTNPFSDLAMPLGISFYTFQAIGYIADIYRGRAEPEKSLPRYALYISFFPKLLQGPIERPGNLLRQIERLEQIDVRSYDRITAGLAEALWGLYQKMVLADRLGIFVDAVFGNISACGTAELLAASLAYTLQIYLDFNGYTCMALGIAKVLGLELLPNFDAPYFATSVGDFWRRWHITLSTWLRDYVYIPLGGSRCSKGRHYLNLMATMLLSGLWHGADWSFVLWGGIHGAYQIIGKLSHPWREKLRKALQVDTTPFSYRLGQRLCTFALVSFAWIFFRAQSVGQAMQYIVRMFTRWNPWVLVDGSFYAKPDPADLIILLVGLLILFVADCVRYRTGQSFSDVLQRQNLWFRWCVYLGLLISIFVFGEYGIHFSSSAFIYANF